MTLAMNYPDIATFVEVKSGGYSGSKVMLQQFECEVIFLQNTDYGHGNNRDSVDSDAICFPDFNNEFVIANANRLEGMYINMPLYGATDTIAWFKVIKCTINRDHLLSNSIDNIELQLKKSEPVPGVS